MKHNKALIVLLSLVLVLSIAIPTTLAVSLDSTESDETVFVPGETTEPVDETTEPVDETTQPVDETTEPEVTETPDEDVPADETTDPSQPATDEDAPVPEESKELVHAEGCSEDCKNEEGICECDCHKSLFDRLMAAETLEEFLGISSKATKEEIESISAEQNDLLMAHMLSLESQPEPAYVPVEENSTVDSEIYSPTKNYTNVAPFQDPVEG